jgi:hypothetical protein
VDCFPPIPDGKNKEQATAIIGSGALEGKIAAGYEIPTSIGFSLVEQTQLGG